MSGDESSEDATRLTMGDLRDMISEEVAKAQEKSIPILLERLTDTIHSVVAEEIHGKDKDEEEEEEEEELPIRTKKKDLSYKDFMACKPPEYHGETDPILCMRWISEMEGAFEVTECPSRLKVRYVASLLRSRGKSWWDMNKQSLGVDIANVNHGVSSRKCLRWPSV